MDNASVQYVARNDPPVFEIHAGNFGFLGTRQPLRGQPIRPASGFMRMSVDRRRGS